MGNTVIWKPASSSMLSSYYIMKLLEEAGLPPGVINFVPGDAALISDKLLSHRDLAGVHFTGSTAVFNNMWKTIGASMSRYKSYPRIVGETGGKDFIVAHQSADPVALSVAIARGGFEYQGQKCSAASRVYIPESIWPEVRDRTVAIMKDIRVGDITDFRNFMGAVIDKKAFTKISEYLEHGRKNANIVAGGVARGEDGYFIEPTLIETKDPGYRLLCEEIFGPIVSVHVYPDAKWEATLRIVDQTSPYALTGAVFSRDRQAIREQRSSSATRRHSTSTTSRPARLWVNSRSAGPADQAPTTRPVPSSTSCAGSVRAPSRRPSPRRPITDTRSWPRSRRSTLAPVLPAQKKSREVSVNRDRRNEEDVPLTNSQRGIVVEDSDLGGNAGLARTEPGAKESTERWRIVNRPFVDRNYLHCANPTVGGKAIVVRG